MNTDDRDERDEIEAALLEFLTRKADAQPFEDWLDDWVRRTGREDLRDELSSHRDEVEGVLSLIEGGMPRLGDVLGNLEDGAEPDDGGGDRGAGGGGGSGDQGGAGAADDDLDDPDDPDDPDVDDILDVFDDPGAGITFDIDTAARVADGPAEHMRRIARMGFADRYRLEGELARGGMGIVHRVWDRHLKRPVAMKVALPQGQQGAPRAASSSHGSGGSNGTSAVAEPATGQILARFLDEALVTGQLDHPNIVPVHQLGVDENGRAFFTMKLVRGDNLDTISRKVQAGADGWGLNRAVGVLRRVCEAVAYAHSKGVIHRDIKPANVMVGRYGETYLMDWGVARVVGQEPPEHDELDQAIQDATSEDPRGGRPRHAPALEAPPGDDAPPDTWLFTRDGKVLGTPIYMSPEQARGDVARVDHRSDVYSLGAILYHLLAGCRPYADAIANAQAKRLGVIGVLTWVQRQAPLPLAELEPDAPPTLVEICERAMAREPDERYPDAGVMATALGDYLEDISEAREEARRQARRAELINAFLLRMLGTADPSRALGREVTVREVLDEAAERVERGFEGQPLDEAALRRTIGNLYTQLGHFAAAVTHLEKAYDLVAGARAKEDDPEALELLAELSHPLRMERGPAEAVQLLNSVLPRLKQALGEEHATVVRAKSFLAWTLVASIEGAAEAAKLFREVLDWRKAQADPDPEETLEIVAGLGHALDVGGRPGEAVQVLEEHRADLLDALPRRAMVTLLYDNGLLQALGHLGHHAEEERRARDLRDRCEEVLGPDHYMVFNTANAIGLAVSRQEKYDEAEALYAELVVQADAVHPGTAHSLACHHNRGLNLLEAKRLPRAFEILASTVRDAERDLDPGHGAIGRFRFTLARCLRRMGRFDEARAALTEARRELLAALGPDHPWSQDARAEQEALDAEDPPATPGPARDAPGDEPEPGSDPEPEPGPGDDERA